MDDLDQLLDQSEGSVAVAAPPPAGDDLDALIDSTPDIAPSRTVGGDIKAAIKGTTTRVPLMAERQMRVTEQGDQSSYANLLGDLFTGGMAQVLAGAMGQKPVTPPSPGQPATPMPRDQRIASLETKLESPELRASREAANSKLRTIIFDAASSAPDSLVSLGAGLLSGPLAPFTVAHLYGAAEYDQFSRQAEEYLRGQGMPVEQAKSVARSAAVKTGWLEGGIEGASTVLEIATAGGVKLFRHFATDPAKRAIKEGAKKTIGEALKKAGLAAAGVEATEAAEEFLTGAGQAKVKQDIGMPTPSPLEAGAQGAATALLSAAPLAGVGGAARYGAERVGSAQPQPIAEPRPSTLPAVPTVPAVASGEAPSIETPAAPEQTVPESPETIAEQFKLATDPESAKGAVLVPQSYLDEGHEVNALGLPHYGEVEGKGVLFFNPKKVTQEQVQAAIANDQLGQLLGMSQPTKPAEGAVVVQTKTPEGTPVQDEVVATPEQAITAVKAGEAAVPGGTVTVTTPEKVIEERKETKPKPSKEEFFKAVYDLMTPREQSEFSFSTPETMEMIDEYYGSGKYTPEEAIASIRVLNQTIPKEGGEADVQTQGQEEKAGLLEDGGGVQGATSPTATIQTQPAAARPEQAKPDGPVISVDQEIHALIHAEDGPGVKSSRIRKLAKQEGVTPKQMQERVEVAVVDNVDAIARGQQLGPREKFDQILSIYRKQPTLSGRTSTSVANQAYSTPGPLAFAVRHMTRATPQSSAYDATAGNGMLLIGTDKSSSLGNELNEERYRALLAQGIPATKSDATKTVPKTKFQVVHLNPPFASIPNTNYDGFGIRRLEHLIALKGLEAMEDNGTAAIIVGAKREEGESGRGAQWVFENYLYGHYNVVDNFEVEGGLYAKQGASWPVRVLIIAGRRSNPVTADLAPKHVDRLKSWDDIWARAERTRNEVERQRASLGTTGPAAIPSNPADGTKTTDRPGGIPEPAVVPSGATGGGGKRGGGRGSKPKTPRPATGGVSPTPTEQPSGKPGDTGQPDVQPSGGGKPSTRVEDGGTRSDEPAADGTKRGEGDSGKPQPGGVRQPSDVKADDLANVSDSDLDALIDDAINPAAALLEAAKKHGVTGASEALKGLSDLFGGGKNIGAGIPTFDEETYAKAKPHFQKAYDEFVSAGKSLGEYIKFLVDQFGANIKPYIKRFAQDLKNAASKVNQKVSEYQVRYFPRSTAKPFDTVSPNSIADAMHAAADELKGRVGSLDAYVAGKLGMTSLKGLAGEQVDTAALMIDQIENGDALIVGHETGIGKGRIGAIAIRYAIEQGKIPVFFTKEPKLFSDMMGDLQAIGTTLKPFLIGDPAEATIVNADGDVILKAPSPMMRNREMDRITKDGLKKAGYDAVFVSYSQINGLMAGAGKRGGMVNLTDPTVGNRQGRFLMSLIGENDSVVLMDEAHLAAGDADTSMQAAFFTGGKVQRGKGTGLTEITAPGLLNLPGVQPGRGGVAYMSATYAKRPENMAVYFRTALRRAADSFDEIVAAMENGGVAIQQAVSEALAIAGQYARLERDFSGINYDMKLMKVAYEARLIEQVDEVTSALNEIVRFSRIVKAVTEANPELLPAGMTSTTQSQGAMSSTDFASIVHNQINQLLLAVKSDTVVQEAVAAHNRGEKPIIAVMNTMESFLDGYAKEHNIKPGQKFALRWHELAEYALSRTLRFTEKLPNGDTIIHTVTPQDLGLENEYQAIVDQIRDMDANFPVSPIDYIIQKMEAEGVKMGELTGRHSGITYTDFGKNEGTYRVFQKARKNTLVSGFNKGDLGGLLLNASGSTGLSIHSSEQFKDQKPRHMFIAQAALDINVFVQTLGRIKRTGMKLLGVNPDGTRWGARYTHLVLPVQAETRPAAMAAKKMKSLNANTTAAAESAVKIDVEDIYNRYGDAVVSEFLDSRPDLQSRLGIHIETKTDGSPSVQRDVASQFTGRIAYALTNAEQKAAYDEILTNYRERIEQLKAMGEYDLEIVTHDDWDGVQQSSEVLAPGTGNKHILERDVKMEQWEIRDRRHVPTGAEMRAEFEKNLKGPQQLGDKWREFQQQVEERFDRRTQQLQNERAAITDDGTPESKKKIESVDNDLHRLDEQHQRWHGQVRLVIHDVLYDGGQIIELTNKETGESYEGMLVDVKLPKLGDGVPRVSGSAFKFKFMVHVPGGVIHATGSQFNPDMWSKGDARGTGGVTPEDLQGGDPNARYTRWFVVGNPIRSFTATGGRGKLVRFQSRDKETVTGRLMPMNWNPTQLANDPRLELVNGKAVSHFLKQHGRNVGRPVPVESGNVVRMQAKYSSGPDYIISTAAARSTGGPIYLDAELRRTTGDFTKTGNRYTVTIDEAQIAKVADRIMAITGARFRPQGDATTLTPQVSESNQRGAPKAKSKAPTFGHVGVTLDDALDAEASFSGPLRRWFEKTGIGVKFMTLREAETWQRNHASDVVRSVDIEAMQGFYDPDTGTVAVVLDNVGVKRGETPQQAVAKIILHEVIGHKGLAALRETDSEFAGLFDRMAKLIPAGDLKKLVKSYPQFKDYRTNAESYRSLAEEWFAEHMETEPTRPIVRKIIDAIVRWVKRNMGWQGSEDMLQDAVVELMGKSKLALTVKPGSGTGQVMASTVNRFETRWEGQEDELYRARSIEPPHEIRDIEKRSTLHKSMSEMGWVGRPLLIYADDAQTAALTGSHRLSVAKELNIEVPVVRIDNEKLNSWWVEHHADDSYTIDQFLKEDDETQLRIFREMGDRRSYRLLADELRANSTGLKQQGRPVSESARADKPSPSQAQSSDRFNPHPGEGATDQTKPQPPESGNTKTPSFSMRLRPENPTQGAIASAFNKTYIDSKGAPKEPGSLRELLRVIYHQMVHKEAAIENTQRAHGGRAYQMVQRQRGTTGIVAEILGEKSFWRNLIGIKDSDEVLYWNVETGKLDTKGKNLRAILEPIADQMEDFNTLLAVETGLERAKRDIERAESGELLGFTPDEARAALESLEQKWGRNYQKLRDIAKEYRQWKIEFQLKPLLSIGRISQAQYDKMLDTHQFHAPLNRLMDEAEKAGHVPASRTFQPKGKPIHKFKGSGRKILNLVESDIIRTYQIQDWVWRQAVAEDLVKQSEADPAFRVAMQLREEKRKAVPLRDIRPEGHTIKENAAGMWEVRNETGGLISIHPTEAQAEKSEMQTVWGLSPLQPSGTFQVWRDGKPKFYTARKDLLESINGMAPWEANVAIKALTPFARMLRTGATAALEFSLRNPVTDTFGAFIMTKGKGLTPGFIPVWDSFAGLFQVIGHGKWYHEAQASGALQSTMMSLDRTTARKTQEDLTGQRSARRIASYANPLEVLRAISNLGEESTRIGVFRRQRLLGRSALEATSQTRESTIDFARVGTVGRSLNQIAAFYNVGIQGPDRVRRAFRDDPFGTGAKIFLSITMPSLLLWFVNHDDDEYKEFEPWLKNNFWLIKMPNGTWARIKKPHEVGLIFGSALERLMEKMLQDNPRAMKGLFTSIQEAVTPNVIPTAAHVVGQAAVDYDTFRNRSIVPEGKKRLDAEFQYTDYTSESAKQIGKRVGISPAKVDFIIRGYGGTLGLYATGMADKIMETAGVTAATNPPEKTAADTPVIRAYAARSPKGPSSASVQSFWEMYRKATTAKNSAVFLEKQGQDVDAYLQKRPEAYLAKELEQVAEAMRKIDEQKRAVEKAKDIDPAQKRKAIDELNSLMTEICADIVKGSDANLAEMESRRQP